MLRQVLVDFRDIWNKNESLVFFGHRNTLWLLKYRSRLLFSFKENKSILMILGGYLFIYKWMRLAESDSGPQYSLAKTAT